MNEENKEPQINNLPPTDFNTPKSGNSKFAISIGSVFIVLLITVFFVYKNYFPQNTSDTAGFSLYKDTDTAIAFQYPQTLSLLDRDEDGNKMLPNIFFQNYQYSNGYSRDVCPVDCINFSAFLRPGNGLPSYDIPLRVEKNNPKFPIYDYPQYVYQDETGSKPFQINGMEAVRYYATGFKDSDSQANSIGRREGEVLLNYVLEDRVFIKDPNLEGRIIYVVYQENTNKLPADAQSLTGAMIKGLFDKEKHKQFENILSSVEVAGANENQFTTRSFKYLGISFHVPKYWGNTVELIGREFDPVLSSPPKVERISLFFKSSALSLNSQPPIQFEADNSKSAKYVYEGPPAFYQYSGQSLDKACQNNAYLDSSNARDITLSNCNLRTLPNGLRLVVFSGSYTVPFSSMGEEATDQPLLFKGAILKTKSTKWPGMTIHFEDTGNSFSDKEKLFDKIINSLSYIAVSDSNTITKNNWGVSFTKSSDWNVTSNTNEQINLGQVSGEWTGDKIDISYVSDTNITTTDAKFGSVTYYYDTTNQQWMKIGQSEKTGDTESPVPATTYTEYPYTADNFPVFVGTNRWLTLIVPLSHTTFLRLHVTGSGQTQPLRDLLRTVRKI